MGFFDPNNIYLFDRLAKWWLLSSWSLLYNVIVQIVLTGPRPLFCIFSCPPKYVSSFFVNTCHQTVRSACQDTCLVFLWVSSLQWSLEASCSFKTLLWSTYNGWRIVNVSPPQLYIPVIPWCFNFGIDSSFPALALLIRGRWGSLFFAIKDTSVRDPNRQCKTTQHNMQWTHTHFFRSNFLALLEAAVFDTTCGK